MDSDRQIVAQVAAIAARRGVSRAQIASAWILSKPFVTAPIVARRSRTTWRTLSRRSA